MSQFEINLIRPVILCGGAGTRLWPLSRQSMPKQYLPLLGERSLLQETLKRLSGKSFAPALIVSGEEQVSLVEQQLANVRSPVEAILLEPVGRNTAAAAGLAAEWTVSNRGDDLLLIMPSDHLISDTDAFLRAIEIGTPLAETGAIITFGAEPTEPNTQYGYIEANSDEPVANGVFSIARFHEKPTAERAVEYLAKGGFYWNCGIFLAKASAILREMGEHLPESLAHVDASVKAGTSQGRFFRPAAQEFARAENISIDNGIMEKTHRGIVIPVQMQWSDVGAWDAVWKHSERDSAGNVKHGKVLALDTRGSLLRSDGDQLIATVGLDDIVVIAAGNAVLVAPLDRAFDVKKIVEALNTADKSVASPET